MRTGAAFLALGLVAACAPSSGPEPLGASRFNGTWQMSEGRSSGTIELWALDERTLRMEIVANYAYDTEDGPTANTGEQAGTAVVDGDSLLFAPEDDAEACAITLRLRGRNALQAGQTGSCGFGWRVTAAGRYRRTSQERPSFELSTRPDPRFPAHAAAPAANAQPLTPAPPEIR